MVAAPTAAASVAVSSTVRIARTISSTMAPRFYPFHSPNPVGYTGDPLPRSRLSLSLFLSSSPFQTFPPRRRRSTTTNAIILPRTVPRTFLFFFFLLLLFASSFLLPSLLVTSDPLVSVYTARLAQARTCTIGTWLNVETRVGKVVTRGFDATTADPAPPRKYSGYRGQRGESGR